MNLVGAKLVANSFTCIFSATQIRLVTSTGLISAKVVKLKWPGTKERKFDDVVKDAEKAAVPVLVY